ncbi:hypothetical protein LUX57_47145 [Actinomadura madurae]|uniref:hypothetical protein n=1 Tax=Actinomadura madurae TaxID=1993 RepID=UPI0020D26122|nr:hypothetical protein [Actinomadura madurae]MCP9971741.1 hypothetical protein [Actinomadura madurae]
MVSRHHLGLMKTVPLCAAVLALPLAARLFRVGRVGRQDRQAGRRWRSWPSRPTAP